MNDVDAMVAICEEFPSARVIVPTTYVGDALVLRALNAGARAYLLKGLLRKKLLESIRLVHAGQKRIVPVVAAELAEHAIDDALSATLPGSRCSSPVRPRVPITIRSILAVSASRGIWCFGLPTTTREVAATLAAAQDRTRVASRSLASLIRRSLRSGTSKK